MEGAPESMNKSANLANFRSSIRCCLCLFVLSTLVARADCGLTLFIQQEYQQLISIAAKNLPG